MAREKRTSPILDLATARAAALEGIDKNLDLGSGLTLVAYKTSIASISALLDDYDQKLGEADAALNALQSSEKSLKDTHERMLTGIATKYGKDSSEYEKAGGTRKSERKKPAPRSKKPVA